MRHTDAKEGRAVKVKKEFSLSGDMSIPVDKDTPSRSIIRKGTRGTVTGSSLRIRGGSYVPVKINGKQLDVRVEYLELA